MSFLLRQVAHCDVCGHEWLTAKVPSHCAKCKSRKWNQDRPLKHRTEVADLPEAIVPSAKNAKFKVGEHNPKTCRIYKCGMCAAMKGS